MKKGLFLSFLLILFFGTALGQSGRKGLTPKLSAEPDQLPDSLIYQEKDSTLIKRNRTAYRLTEKLGERYVAPMDTCRLNFSNSSLMEGYGIAISYLANVGASAQSRVFSEREEENDFIFANSYQYYITTPTNALFYDVKDPYTRLTYLPRLFSNRNMSEERFNGVLTTNLGKKINIGMDFDYTLVRGHYASNGNKLLYYRLFGSYLTDRYEMHAYFRNHNYLHSENGGLTNDRYITHPDDFTEGKRPINDTKSFPTRFSNTWNRNKGKQLFLTHRYNLGFYREMTGREKEDAEKRRDAQRVLKEKQLEEEALLHESHDHPQEQPQEQPAMQDVFSGANNEQEEEEEIDAVFVPVSSIIHTFDYEGNSRRFISKTNLDTCYTNPYNSPVYGSPDSLTNDFTEAWQLKNTVALSLREGFQDWVKFGLTAYIHLEKRQFKLPGDSVRGAVTYDEFSTYLGAELSKRQGKLLTYKVRGEFCPAGDDLGEFRINGDLKTQFRLLGREASITATGYFKNLTPAFYTRHHHSRFFWWDRPLKNIQRFFVGGAVDLQQTRTQLSAGVESIQNFIYFGKTGVPEQYGSNLQIITARIKQDFRYKALGWENEIVYQLSSEKSVLPLPQLAAYTNLYLDFTYAKVLNIQIGADAHLYTSYYAPYYEPATQQFQIQDEKKIGNYPLINAYLNFNLKQARFFISAYNLGSLFIEPPKYFSSLHYPLNPMKIKLGISFYMNN